MSDLLNDINEILDSNRPLATLSTLLRLLHSAGDYIENAERRQKTLQPFIEAYVMADSNVDGLMFEEAYEREHTAAISLSNEICRMMESTAASDAPKHCRECDPRDRFRPIPCFSCTCHKPEEEQKCPKCGLAKSEHQPGYGANLCTFYKPEAPKDRDTCKHCGERDILVGHECDVTWIPKEHEIEVGDEVKVKNTGLQVAKVTKIFKGEDGIWSANLDYGIGEYTGVHINALELVTKASKEPSRSQLRVQDAIASRWSAGETAESLARDFGFVPGAIMDMLREEMRERGEAIERLQKGNA